MNANRKHNIDRMLSVMDEPTTIAQVSERIHAMPNTVRLWIIEALKHNWIEACERVETKVAGGRPMTYRRK